MSRFGLFLHSMLCAALVSALVPHIAREQLLAKQITDGRDRRLTWDRRRVIGEVAAFAVVLLPTSHAYADVSDGTSLPQGAQQFQKVLRIRNDIPQVKKRVSEASGDIDKAEWENIGKFLRNVYATGDDMKSVALGIANPDNQKRALEDVAQLKKYAQAGDIPLGKQDGPGFVAVASKMQDLVEDFFDSLNDVPDEI